MTITSAARRWFGEVVKREDSMGLMIVRPYSHSRPGIELIDSKEYIMRMCFPAPIMYTRPP
jgi:hypothetical protein